MFETLTVCMDEINGYREQLFFDLDPTLPTETVRVLLQYQFERSAAVYDLLVNRMVWDAEIILRSIYETSAKIMFIGAHNDCARDDLVRQYWGELSSIYDRKGASKADEAERFRRRYAPVDNNDLRVYRYLRDPKIFNLDAVGNKAFRDKVERRWSFSEIVKTLQSKSDCHIKVEGLTALLHAYGMASHLAHASPKAMDLMDDRATRGDDLLELEVGHICRIVSDTVLLAAFSTRFSQRAIDGTEHLAEKLNSVTLKMVEATTPLQEKFARSQDDFYSRQT